MEILNKVISFGDLNDAIIVEEHVFGAGRDDHHVMLWRVRGLDVLWFPTKEVAEKVARKCFPDEDEDKRDARVSYRVFKEV